MTEDGSAVDGRSWSWANAYPRLKDPVYVRALDLIIEGWGGMIRAHAEVDRLRARLDEVAPGWDDE